MSILLENILNSFENCIIMQEKDILKKIAFIFLLCIILFHLINNYIILSNNNAPFCCDSAFYILQSYQRYELISNHYYLETYHTPLTWSYPILYSLLSLPFYFVFGVGTIAPIMTNSIFLIILVFSIYGIGTHFHSRKAGLLSAFIVTSFPHVFSLSRTYLFDYPLLATVALSLFCLLKTKRFKDKKWSILFGLSTGFSALIKPTFIIFLIGPLCVYLYNSFINKNLLNYKKFNNLILAFIIALCLGGLGYLPPHLDAFLAHISHVHSYWSNLTLFSYENITDYVKALVNIQILPFYFLLFIFSLRMFLVNRYKSLFLFSWFLIPYLFFTFVIMNVKDPRFLVPYLPVVALLISLNIFSIKSSMIRKFAVILIILIGFSQLFIISYYPNSKILPLLGPNFEFDPNSVPSWSFGVPFAYTSDSGINDLKTFIKDSLAPNTKEISILEFYGFFSSPLVYILPKDLGIDVKIYIEDDKMIIGGYTDNLFMMDYIVVSKNGRTDDEFFVQIDFLTKMLGDLKGIKNVGSVNLPNEVTLFVYKVEEKLEKDYQTDVCNDCFINLTRIKKFDNDYLKIDYVIPHNKKAWRIKLHKVYEFITNYPIDYGWVRISKELNNLDWSDYSSINFKIMGDSHPGKLEFYLIENDGDVWYYSDDKILRNNDWTTLSITFESLKNTVRTGNAVWIGKGNGKKELNNIREIQLVLTSFEIETKKIIYFDMFDNETFYLK